MALASYHESERALHAPERETLEVRLRRCLDRAVDHCADTQTAAGSWGMPPEPRMFDTGVVAFALSRLPASDRVTAAVRRAARWLAAAVPQTHHPLARLMEELPHRLLTGARDRIDLRDPAFFTPILRRKTLLLHALATVAGCGVDAPIPLEQIRASLVAKLAEPIEMKRWGRADLAAVHVLLGNEPGPGLEALVPLQSADGGFVHNPISTALAGLALVVAAPGSPALVRCTERLLQTQLPDGTWRFFETDVWDTSLMVRTFRRHPGFRARCLPRALAFLRAAQNADGGWGFRSALESDNDSTACALMCFVDPSPEDRPLVHRALELLARMQRPDGLWRTWQSAEDAPAKDCIAHVIETLRLHGGEHQIESARARAWLRAALSGAGDRVERWRADWYHSTTYGLLEIGRALGPADPLGRDVERVLDQLQREDGSWAVEPDGAGTPLDTGLGLAARLARVGALDAASLRAVEFLLRSQAPDGTWPGRPCMVGPRPLLIEMGTNTHAFTAWGLVEACC